ncbi:T-cell surface protein tactile [Salarias fasciatus]|uniref:T-cell surface protein tactile n=1 Tax=Salarias fasciatus TaxID=181472 RepID=UPI0011766D30|nr:T-cell surface protein tactile-like [Salarias fasciatus]
MSFGNSNMDGSALGATFSLLLLASIIQGFQVGAGLHYDEEAAVGQSITLRCSIKNYTNLKLSNIEWSKKNGIKLVVYSFDYGEYRFQHNLTHQIEYNDTYQKVYSYLHLPEMRKQDSGTYICDISTYPLGTLRTEIKLTVEDEITVECNMENTIEVYTGENVTIDCNTSFPNAQYRWAKNMNVLSDNESLKLRMVTDANAGIYTLTVKRGKKTLNKEFIITVLPASTSWRTDISTVSSQHQDQTTTRNFETTATTNTTNNKSTSSVTTALEELSTTSTNPPYTTVTPSPVPRSHLPNTTTPSYDGTTQEMRRNQTELHTPHTQDTLSTRPEESSSSGNVSSEKPEAAQTVSEGSKTTVTQLKVTDSKDTERGHLLLLLIIIPVLVLIAVAGFLYRRQAIKSRMDLPPPFKPPPPPVKYTAPRHCQTSTQPLYT